MKKLGVLLGIFLILFSSNILADFEENVIAYYPFDNNASDMSGNSNDGTIYGSTLITTGQKLGDGAYNFDGSNDYITTPSITLGSAFSISVWINLNDLVGLQGIFGGQGTSVPGIHLQTNGNILNFAIYTGNGEQLIQTSSILTINKWFHVILTFGGGSRKLYVNGQLSASMVDSGTITTRTWDIGRTYDQNRYFNGIIDDVTLWNRVLNSTEITKVYNNGSGLQLFQNTNFTISTDVSNFNVTINNTQYNTTTGIIETEYIKGEDLLNFTIFSTGYENISYTNYNTTNNININLTPYYYLNNITYNNIINYSNTLYSRNISSIFEIYCNSTTNTNIELIVNNQSIKNQSINCINQLNNYTINYQPINESIHYINYNITSLAIDGYQWNNTINITLIIDLFNPIIEYNYTLNNTFGNIINISTLCYDNITPLLVYNITFNNNIYYGNQSNNTLINNQTTLIDGNNNFIVKCSDFFGTTTINESIDATVKTIQLIDERTGVNFNINSTEKVFVYFSDTNYYSFTSPFVNISSINNTNLRFELEYLDTIITRYIDMSLIDDEDIRVCVSREGTTFYNQDIISATTKPALLKSSFADCYVLAYPLSFAYQDAYSVKAYTRPTLYYLYTKDNGKDILLASFDGAQDSYVNLDTLEFSKTSYQVSLLADALSIDIDRNNNNTLIIYYQNIENENTNIRMVITDENGVVLVDTDELNPNEFTTYFNFNSYQITDKTLFKVTLTKTKEDGTTGEQSKFFDPMGKSGTIQPTFAAILAVLFLFFSLTIVIPRLSLSWLGLLFEIITLLILSFAVPVWYINFLVAINVIILVYTFFMMSQINYPTVVS